MEKDDAGPAPVEIQEKPKQGRGSKKSKTEGLNASDEQCHCRNAQAQTKPTSKVPKSTDAPKRSRKNAEKVISEPKTFNGENECEQSS
ncbi:MAG: hypothetical protein EZS28_038547 [Streblomastix strix]|uniref:Uncharacterized protein n=1 Tax=Streblomastix strix TaxID=222440 RepID=A0A5J4U6G6_9EUKA|nr:MAG: hypothetical protein EZS28_038547 [Streblomastix strix]